MNKLEIVAKRHSRYVHFLTVMGAKTHIEDLVQEMYLRLYKYDVLDKVVDEDGKVNDFYIWRVLNNMFKDYMKDKNRFFFQEINYFENIEDPSIVSPIESEESIIDMNIELYKAINELDTEGYPYNKELFTLYVSSGMSMRCLSSVTGISVTSIFHTINNCRTELKEKLGDKFNELMQSKND